MINQAPLDSTTYLLGNFSWFSGTITLQKIYIPIKGTIRRVILHWYNYTADSTTENTAFSIRLNNTTDYALYTGSVANVESPKTVLMNIPVEVADYVNLKMVCPAWATNPTGMYISLLFEVEY